MGLDVSQHSAKISVASAPQRAVRFQKNHGIQPIIWNHTFPVRVVSELDQFDGWLRNELVILPRRLVRPFGKPQSPIRTNGGDRHVGVSFVHPIRTLYKMISTD